MQRCACWWQTKFDITRPRLTIRCAQARAVWRFPLSRVERTWRGREPGLRRAAAGHARRPRAQPRRRRRPNRQAQQVPHRPRQVAAAGPAGSAPGAGSPSGRRGRRVTPLRIGLRSRLGLSGKRVADDYVGNPQSMPGRSEAYSPGYRSEQCDCGGGTCGPHFGHGSQAGNGARPRSSA